MYLFEFLQVAEWRIFKQTCTSIRLVREKFKIFWYGQYIVVQGRCWGLREICKNVTVILRKNHAKQQRQAATFYAMLTSRRAQHCSEAVAVVHAATGSILGKYDVINQTGSTKPIATQPQEDRARAAGIMHGTEDLKFGRGGSRDFRANRHRPTDRQTDMLVTMPRSAPLPGGLRSKGSFTPDAVRYVAVPCGAV